MIVRVGLGIALVLAGLGVNGATIALTTSFIVTCAIVTVASRSGSTAFGAGIDSREVRAYAALVSILLVGQIIANNSDIFIAKANFTPTDAGIYAAVALVGRAVFFLAWSVATVIFPVVARRHATGGESSALLKGGILAVVGIGVACSLGALWLGGPVLGIVLGPAYAGLSVPLAAYAGMTTLFAVGNLVASYRLSQSKVTESWMLLAASVVQFVLLLIWHDTMTTLISMQAIAMGLLVAALGARAIVTRTLATRASASSSLSESVPEPQEVLI
jgi:O-antigen/teichoic acid export membrane protein